MFDYPLLVMFPLVMAFAGAMDMLTMTIPNRLSLLLIGGFLIAAPLAGLGWYGFAMHLAAGLVVLLIGFGLFAAGWIGGGDIKILASSSLWLGFDFLLPYVILVAILGGLLAIGMLAARFFAPEGSLRVPAWLLRLQAPETGIPYGLAIAAAALWLYPMSDLYRGLAF